MPTLNALRAQIVRAFGVVVGSRWLSRAALAIVSVTALCAGQASAQYTVSSSMDNGSGASGTLSAAIDAANADAAQRVALNEAPITYSISLDTSQFSSPNPTITLSGNLPPILCNLQINGQIVPGVNLTINGTNGTNQYSAFMVASGNVAISNLSIINTNAVGGTGGSTGYYGGGGGGGLGAGGALFVNSGASATIQNVSFTGNSATGGTGGSTNSGNGSGGGGGAGFHGPGGSTSSTGGGGGGGFEGSGGNSNANGSIAYGGGGGGGEYGNGGPSNGYSTAGGGGGGAVLPGGPASGNSAGSGGGLTGGNGGSWNGSGPSAGGYFGGGGGAGYTQSGATGGTFGGGGGAAYSASGSPTSNGGAGGDFGGGGGAGYGGGTAGTGGFGGGGGGGSYGGNNSWGNSAAGGFGGGAGGSINLGSGGNGGDGGDGYGGAVFVRTGGSLTIIDSGISNSTVAGGQGGSGQNNGATGSADGAAMYLMTGTTNNIQVNAGTQTINDSISGSGGFTKIGNGELSLTGTNDYSGGTTVSGGTLLGTTSSVQGAITNNGFVAFDQSTNGTYSGAMTGNGELIKMGTGTVTLTNSSSNYSGGTLVSAGSLQGTTDSLKGNITNNGNVTFNQSGSGTYAGDITGSGSVTKAGTGTVTLTGTSNYGGTTVSGGTLLVDGALTSDATVDSGGTLGGDGTITGNVTNNGTFAPGDPTTTTINGNYSQNSGGNMLIQITTPGNTPGVNSSLLVVNGTAHVAGNVEVQPASGSYTLGTEYIFLKATTIDGQFSSITVDNPLYSAMIGYQMVGNIDEAYFMILDDFRRYAETPNQIAVANYIDDNSANPDSGWQNMINTLNSLSPSQVRNALDQMSGAIYGSVAQTDFQSTSIELSFITRRIANGLSGVNGAPGGLATNSYGNKINASSLAANDANLVIRGQNVYAPFMPQGRWTTWGFGYGLGGNAQGTSNAAGLNYSLGGTVAGLEMRDDNHLIGGYAGYVGSHVGSYLAGQSVNVNGGQTGVYLRGDDGRNYYIALLGMGADGYNSHRLMQFGGINTTAFANYGGWQSQAYFERGITLQNDSVSLQPYAALQYLYVRQNSFTETDAGAMNLKVAGIDANSLRSLIGIRLAGNAGLSMGGGAITPVARALWLHEFLSTNTGLNAQFAPIGGTSFAVTGTSLGRDWAILGTGLNWNLSRGWQAYANYDAQVNVVQTFHVGSGGFQYSW